MSEKAQQKKLSSSIWALGFVSLFMDTSSEVVHGLLPVFLVTVLGASVTSIGFLEGLSEATVLILKVFSGPISDYLGKRKPLVLLGYAMGALSKPLFALAGSLPVVYGARLFDRIGKGIRSSPRDALLADLSPPELRGRAFGLRQSLDTVGAFLGSLFAIILMQMTSGNYRLVFWLAVIPGILSVTTLLFGVKEQEVNKKAVSNRNMSVNDIKDFPFVFWFVVGAGALFQLARFSEAFLILRAKDFGLGLHLPPVVLIVMNIVYSIAAYPIGHFSDRVPREWFLVAGLVVLAFSDLILAQAHNLKMTFLGVTLWGLHMGLTQGTLAALVADTSSPDRRGTAYGVFNLFSAAALLLASAIAGILWDQAGQKITFLVGGGFSLLSLIAFVLMRTLWRKKLIRSTANQSIG